MSESETSVYVGPYRKAYAIDSQSLPLLPGFPKEMLEKEERYAALMNLRSGQAAITGSVS